MRRTTLFTYALEKKIFPKHPQISEQCRKMPQNGAKRRKNFQPFCGIFAPRLCASAVKEELIALNVGKSATSATLLSISNLAQNIGNISATNRQHIGNIVVNQQLMRKTGNDLPRTVAALR